MRQVINVSFVAQAESKTDDAEFEAWLTALETPPGERPKRQRSRVDDATLDLLGFGGVGNV